MLDRKLHLPAGYTLKWSGEYEFQLRARKRLTVILPIVFGLIFVLLYMLFQSVTEAIVLIFHCVRDDWRAAAPVHDGLQLQRRRVGRLHRAVRNRRRDGRRHGDLSSRSLNRHIAAGELTHEGVEAAVIEGAVQRLRPKLMTVAVVMLSLAPILWESGIGSDVMKPIAAPIVGGMITSTIHVLILVPVFFAIMKERALNRATVALARSVEMTFNIGERAFEVGENLRAKAHHPGRAVGDSCSGLKAITNLPRS